MNSELVSSDGESRLIVTPHNCGAKIVIETNIDPDRDNILLELILPISAEEINSQLRKLLSDVRSKLLGQSKSNSAICISDNLWTMTPYKGEDLIEQIGKQWYEIHLEKRPQIDYHVRFLLDVTVIDCFLETSLPN